MSRIVERIGDYSAVIEVQPPGTARLSWHKGDGKRLSRAPRQITESHPGAYKKLREKLKSINNTLKAQMKRIESFYLDDKPMSYDSWHEYYAEHQLMKSISSSLIWRFKNDSQVFTGILQDGELVSADGSKIPTLSKVTQVCLWHPLHSDRGERDAWRKYIWNRSILQPFRQAYREVYEVDRSTDLEAIVSGLYVRQHQFRALLLDRGWSYEFRGSFDNDSTALLSCPGGVHCEIGIRGSSQSVSKMGIALAVELSDFSFFKGDKKVAAATIPRVLYSEVLRDIDLFTAASGIGYRRDWKDIEMVFREVAEFRESTPILLGNLLDSHPLLKAMSGVLARLDASMDSRPVPETVKTRAYLLDVLLQGSSFADRVRIDGRYVFVNGAEGRYRINLASGLVFDCADNGLQGAVRKTQDTKVPGEARPDILLARIYDAIVSLARPQ